MRTALMSLMSSSPFLSGRVKSVSTRSGLLRMTPFKRLRGILRFAANDHVGLVVDQIRKSAARHRMIINDQDARLI